MFDIVIRPLTSEDTPFLWEMLYHAIFVPPGQEPPPRDVVNDPRNAMYVREWGRPGDYGVVVMDTLTDRRVGAAWLRLYDSADPPYGFIAENIPEISIALLPGFRNRGIGTTLLEHLIAHATARYPALSLSVVDVNPAFRLYKRVGFVEVSSAGHSVTMRHSLERVAGP